jgi:glycosyltransferase involved in cell wall biosynthesis
MRICMICVEIFAWGKYGGFGRATRMIGRELALRGVDVAAIVPRRSGQGAEEWLDGIRVLSFAPFNLPRALRLFRDVDADIYHSQEPSLLSFLAEAAAPEKRHMVTFRDTRDDEDWRTELRLPSLSRAQVRFNRIFEDNFLVHRAVRAADAHFAASKLLIPKAQRKYQLDAAPAFLPTPVLVPDETVKAPRPTVAFVSRWDRRKRPEKFFRLPEAFPEVQFIAAGNSRDQEYDRYLRSRYGSIPNLEMMDFIDQFRGDLFSRVLGESWILVNTSARESLPNSFVEASAHKCALLSELDPDGFVSQFGRRVKDGDFAAGLRELLADDLWRAKGEEGYKYVQRVFGLEEAMDRHMEAYQKLTAAIDHAAESGRGI